MENILLVLIALIVFAVLALSSYHATGIIYRKQKDRSVSI